MPNEVPNSGEPGSIADMVEQIMKSPDFAGIVSELRGGSAEEMPLSQTEILSRLPDVMAMLRPLVGNGDIPAEPAEEKPAELPAEAKTVPAASVLPGKYDKNRAEKLMAALKPYLNRNRCGIIDKCMSFLQITDIMETMRGLDVPGKPKP